MAPACFSVGVEARSVCVCVCVCVCVWKTVWKSLLQNSTKSPRELVESSVAAADPQADEDTWSHANIGLWPDDDREINIFDQ